MQALEDQKMGLSTAFAVVKEKILHRQKIVS